MAIRWLAVLVAAALLVAPLPAQERTFEDRAHVLEVQIPVQVVDRAGQPVRGLAAESFRLFDGNKLQEIVGFETVDLDLLTTGPTRTEVDASLSGVARRHFLLLFDLSFSSRAARTVARLAAREFVLNELHSTDLVAVATHSIDRGGRLLVTFTSDRAQVARAIDLLESAELMELGGDPLRLAIEDPGEGPGSTLDSKGAELHYGGTSSAIEGGSDATLWLLGEEMRKGERNQARGRISSWAASLGDLARMLEVVPGAKQVVYFSEGFDGRLFLGRDSTTFDSQSSPEVLELERWWQRTSPDEDVYGNSPLRGDVDRMLEELRRAGCVLYAFDISPPTAAAAQQRDRRARRDSLFYLARGTGGELVEGAGDLGARFSKLGQRTSVTYILSFLAEPDDEPGTYRRVKVKANAPRAARLAYRQSYRIPRPYADLHPLERSLLAAEAVSGAVDAVEVEVKLLAAAFRSGETSAYVPVVIEIEGASLLETHAGALLPLEIYAYATDPQGRMAGYFSRRLALDLALAGDKLQTGGVKYYGHLELPTGEYRLRVLARNSSTGRGGVATQALAIPAFRDGERVFLPPFFLEPRPDWILVRERQSEQDQQQGAVVYPFTVNGAPYVPAAGPRLKSGENVQLCLVAYNLTAGDIQVEGSLLALDGRLIASDLPLETDRTVTGIRDVDKFLTSLRLPELEPGDYALQISLVDAASGSAETGTVEFRLIG